MSLALHNLTPKSNSRKRRRRLGRGNGSRGTTAGRGTKGQRSRTGGTRGIIRRSMRSIMERVAKQRGFTSRHGKYAVVNLAELERVFMVNEVVSAESLHTKNVIRVAVDGVKILGTGSLSKALTVRAHAVSESAKAAIEKAGGTVVLLGTRPPQKAKRVKQEG